MKGWNENIDNFDLLSVSRTKYRKSFFKAFKKTSDNETICHRQEILALIKIY